MSKEYLPDQEKRILLSALGHEKKLVQDNYLMELLPVVKNLEFKFMYDRLFKQIEKNAYEQGRADEKRENEQDAYHRGYIDGKINCSFENERKIRADERKRIKEAIYDFIADEVGKYTGDDRFIVEEWRKELMKINKRLGEIVRGEK